jgi:hypothetical protein
MPTAKKRGSRKRKQAEERKALMADVAERDKEKEPPKRYTGVQVFADEGGPRITKKMRQARKTPERGAGPTAPHTSKAFHPVMGKPKSREEMSLWERWYESHGDRFESWNEAREHFQEKVCKHPTRMQHYISTKNRPGGSRVHIYSCEGCGKMTKRQSPPSGH